MPDEQWTWCLDRVIASDTASGRGVLNEVLAKLQSDDWPRRDIFGVHLALEEALVNALVHGNRQDPDKQIEVHCRLSPERIRIEIIDEGAGYNPRALADPTDPDRLEAPGGRGVMLMRAFMTRVEHLDRGRHVILEKDRECPV